MARLVICTEKKPLKFEVNGETIAICQCGLSKKRPYCDGSHKRARDEDDNKLYVYDENSRVEIKFNPYF